MAWTETTRRNYVRRTSRYASDLTDREWEFIAPFLPAPRRLGRPRKTDLRQVVNALLYIASTGCQWRMLPKDFPPCSTVQRYFYEWRAMGLWLRINHHLVMEARELEGSRFQNRIADIVAQRPGKTSDLHAAQRLPHRHAAQSTCGRALLQICISESRGHAASLVSPLASRFFNAPVATTRSIFQ